MSEVYQDILRNDGDRAMCREILAGNLGEDQRLDRLGVVREATIHTDEARTDDVQGIGRLISLFGKGGGCNSHVLGATITTLLQRHGWSMSNIMVSSTIGKAASLINA